MSTRSRGAGGAKSALLGAALGVVCGGAAAAAAIALVGFASNRPYLLGAATGVATALVVGAVRRASVTESIAKAIASIVLGVGAMWILRHWVPGSIGVTPIAALPITGAALGAMLGADRQRV